jgi:hypothetical protein
MKVGDMVKRNEVDPRGNDVVRIGIIVDTMFSNPTPSPSIITYTRSVGSVITALSGTQQKGWRL